MTGGYRYPSWKAVFGYLLAAATVYFVAKHFNVQKEAFVDSFSTLTPAALLVSILAFSLHLALNALAFAPLNRAFGVTLPTATLSTVWSATLLTKYIPGGVWNMLGRGLLLTKRGVTSRVVIAVGIVEQVISLALCALIAAVLLSPLSSNRIWAWFAVLAAAVTLVVLTAPLARFLGVQFTLRHFLRALTGYMLAMAPYGLGYFVIVSPTDTSQFLAALFGGTVAGVLAVPAPGGLGVRESATALLSNSTDPARLFAGMFAARGLMLIVESLASIASFQILRRRSPT